MTHVPRLIARQKGLLGSCHSEQFRFPLVLPFANPIVDQVVQRGTEALDKRAGCGAFHL